MKKILLVIIISGIVNFSFSQNKDLLRTSKITKDCTLFETIEIGSNKIDRIKKGNLVTVLDFIHGYYYVEYNSKRGYIIDVFINDPELKKIISASNYAKRKKELIGKFGERIADYILNKNVFIGMTKEQASLSWGSPSSINKTENGNNISEQWVYNYGNYKSKYLYFDDGILKTIQN